MLSQEKTIGVLGAGLMGHGITLLAAKAGYKTTMVDQSEEIVEKAMQIIKKNLRHEVNSNKITETIAENISNCITLSSQVEDLQFCDVVIEAIPEVLTLKKDAFSLLDKICKPSTILATNTSQLSISEIASATQRVNQVIGMHFFYPAQIMQLVEIPLGEHTSQETRNSIVNIAKNMGKSPIVCKDSPGFIVNRLLAGMMVEATRMYDEQVASIEDIDRAIKLGLGHPMGPYELFDFSGIDTMVRAADGLRDALGERFLLGTGIRSKMRAGDLGRKTGKGFYTYE